MEKFESCLNHLMKRQPEIALHLLQAEPSLFLEPFSEGEWDFSLSSCWWIDGYQANMKWKNWLYDRLDHRLFLVFEDMQAIRGWLEHSPVASLVSVSNVTFICLKGPGSLSLQQLRQYIWSNPGFDVGYWDPCHRFRAFFDVCRPLVFHRKAVVREMMKLGAWNWPHIFRRLLSISQEKRLPSQLDWQHIPICVVGAGVSVAEEADLLGKLKQRALMLSAGTAINVLEALGQTPHLAMTIDPFRAQYSRFNQVASIETPLAAGWRSHYQAVNCMKGPRILIPGATAYPMTAFWQQQCNYECSGLEEGPNVVTTAMSLATYLGASQVFLLGVDLCLREKCLYGAGVRSSEAFYQPPDLQEDEVILAPSDEGEVSTYAKWLGEAQWISQFAEKGCQIFRNQAPHLQIPHTVSIKTSEWIKDLPARDYEGWFWAWVQSLENVSSDDGKQFIETLINQVEASDLWLEEQRKMFDLLLAPHSISHLEAPLGEKAFLALSVDVECALEIFQSELQDLELYGPLFENWLVCFDRVYRPAFDVLREGKEGLLWLDAWLFIRKMYFLAEAVQSFKTWLQEVQKGQFLSEVEGV